MNEFPVELVMLVTTVLVFFLNYSLDDSFDSCADKFVSAAIATYAQLACVIVFAVIVRAIAQRI